MNIVSKIQNLIRNVRLASVRKQLIPNQQRTIFCNMCLGGILYHDYGLKFNSPFINLMIPAHEYVDLLSNAKHILGEAKKLKSEKNYPLALLHEKWHLHFMHYKTYEEAIEKWNVRAARVDYDHVYCILVETGSCSYDDLVKFDSLPYIHKIALVHKPYPEIKCAKLIKGYDGQNLNGEILGFQRLSSYKLFDQVDWVRFLELERI